jgi:sulfonate transport system substrate-binding protein
MGVKPFLSSSSFRVLVASLVAQLCLLGALGCDKERPEATRADNLAAAQPGLERITIKFSDPGNAGVLAYAKREGTLERELAKVNASIEWVPAAGAFSANFDAMNSGAMNASAGAISPVIGALAHNLKFRIFAIGEPSDMRQAGIISPASSGIKRVEDLVGKRVAVNFAAHGDYILLKALADHGIAFDSVTRVPIQPPDAAAAFATGKIDAWSTFGVFFATAVQNGANVIAREADINSDDVTITSASEEVLRKNPTAFQVFIRVQAELANEARQHPEKFVNIFTDKGPTAVTGERLAIAIEEARATPIQRAPTATDRVRVANVAKIFVEAKSIDRPLTVDDIVFDVDAAANAKVAEVAR